MVMAFIVYLDKVDVVVKFIGNILKEILTWVAKLMTGGYGAKLALTVNGGALFALGFVIGGNNGQNVATIGALVIIGVIVHTGMNTTEKLKFFK